MHALNRKESILFCIVAGILIAGTFKFFPFERLISNEHADNPSNCPYYFTLQSVLTSFPALSNDKANVRFIHHKLLKFERDITRSKAPATLISPYKTAYFATLASVNLKTIQSVQDENLIIALAQKNMHTIDNYYLNKRIYCTNPLYDWHGPPPARRVLRYNLTGLYDHIPSKYSRLLSAVSDDWLTGSTAGLFFVNQTTTLDARFMTGMPLLTALYVLPKYNFTAIGTYGSAATWNYFRANSFMDPITRKVLDVGGVDVFTVTNKDARAKKIPGTTKLRSTINPVFGPYQSFINTQSYGTAYLAHHITPIDPALVQQHEEYIKHYFARHDDPAAFTKVVGDLYHKLLQLKAKDDILLESSTPINSGSSSPGVVFIKGMVGERNFFTANCQQPSCTFVFNIAKAAGWYAFVNGVKTDIERANFAFMATTIPHGKSTIWFVYSPLLGEITYFISMLSLLGIALRTCKQ